MAGKTEYTMEEVVEYRLFPQLPTFWEQSECELFLETQLDSYLAHLGQLLVGYIWQNEPFQLHVVPTTTAGSPPHLFGRTHFADNVEDEWFIVYLMCHLTQTFPGLVARVNDNDGEILLIEAANSLPKWLNPETAENRVYIHEGKVHVIPRPAVGNTGDANMLPAITPSVEEAVNLVRDYPQITLATERIQKDIERRIGDYPDRAFRNQHRTHCYIPAPLAAVLDHSPGLIGPMVQAFYFRDPIDLKTCVTMKHFQPGTRVAREVKFSRCLYAQLMQQKFQPDKRSGWNLPSTSNPNFKSHDLGMKLSHGAEILCSRCGPVKGQANGVVNQNDARWRRFITALTEKGYFKGELEGSKNYQKLQDEARRYFSDSLIRDPQTSPDPGHQILRALNAASYNLEDMRKQEKHLQPPEDDSWLELSPEEVDDLLIKTTGTMPSSESFDMTSMTDSMRSFVENMSSHEGAEFPPKNPEDADVHFDPNSFIQTMQKMFEFDDPESSDSDDLDEYGSDDSLDLTPKLGPKKKRGPDPPPRSGKKKVGAGGQYAGMKEYMDMMDRELAPTTIGKTFVTKDGVAQGAKSQSKATNGMPKKPAPRASMDDFDDIDELADDDFKPVDVDKNMVQNLMESYHTQQGQAGPTSNILGGMGVKMPDSRKK